MDTTYTPRLAEEDSESSVNSLLFSGLSAEFSVSAGYCGVKGKLMKGEARYWDGKKELRECQWIA